MSVEDRGPDATNGSLKLVNRCLESKSPYVREHANNPVAWQLWTPSTLAQAKASNRLIFLSIGYSACHWCHVMAHESFSDPGIAKILNENFIPIKVDREERPDVDRVYMDFLQATTGGGGWPLNVFLTPDLQPMYGGTYWPGPGSERARMGAGTEAILRKILAAWTEQEERCRQSAAEITRQLRQFAQEGTVSAGGSGNKSEGEECELETIEDAYEHHKARFDSTFGGFGGAPKFPTPSHLSFLLRLAAQPQVVRDLVGNEECENARQMAVKTLENMAKGGIKDQIGHGFARYSVTREWSLPHFEKMLYDNAQLLPLYLDGYLLTGNPLFLETVHDIATYLTSPPMQAANGGFHASEDADSLASATGHEKSEGAFYVWTKEEFRQVLGERDAEVCARYWGVKEDGNVDARFDVQGELRRQNTLCVSCEPAQLAAQLDMSEEEVRRVLRDGRERLRAHRDKFRPRPGLDDKIVVSWNGLALGGLARTAAALAESEPERAAVYLEAAKKAVGFIKRELFCAEDGTLRRVFREGPGETPAFADDYAFLISGLIDLYEATFDDAYLEFADTLQQTQLTRFWDPLHSAFFSTPSHQPDILLRSKDAMDNAEPSTNGAAAMNLHRLACIFSDDA
ncbi:hypothetical protein LTR28_007026, partial [Elasticomyces elasticus]